MPYKARTNSSRPTRTVYDYQRGSAAARGYDDQWRKNRRRFLIKHPLCVMCLAEGRAEPATDVDHIVPKRRGGSDSWSNLQPLCHSHHSQKTAAERRGEA